MGDIKERKRPTISVIVPLFNRRDFIGETLDSIIKQTFDDFEVTIIDDGSTDNSKEIVDKYLNDKRFRYIYQENIGEADTVNKGWRLATGLYFTQVNSDDPIYPNLFEEMVKSFEGKERAVVAYPDFDIVDLKGQILSTTKSPDWNFHEALRDFSCYAAAPGTFIKRSYFKDWKILKDKRFKHINDVNMFWKMALRGEFIHVPKVLASWRSHEAGISAKRFQAIPEIETWYKEYFSQKDLPVEVLLLKEKTRKSILQYFIRLMENSGEKDKDKIINKYSEELNSIKEFRYKNLQISDNDLIGSKFNGHNLHLELRKRGIDSSQLVYDKKSEDDTTYIIAGNRVNRDYFKNANAVIKREYNIDNIVGPFFYDIIFNRLFLESDIVHFHLLHNLDIDISLLPLVSKLKPIVWTIHDPWVLSGHCIEHFNCNKWETGCGDCPLLDVNFKMQKDNSALNHFLKQQAISNSSLDVIVASKFNERKLKRSNLFKNSRIHQIPFGINLDIFKVQDKSKLRAKYDIPTDAIVLLFRCDNIEKKGLQYISYLISKSQNDKRIFFASIGGHWDSEYSKYIHKEFGWISDDSILAEIYGLSDIFLMPSEVESFGMMAIEAMACGSLPVVLKGTALPEVINSDECGVATERDKQAYYSETMKYVKNSNLLNYRVEKCIKYANKEYSYVKYIERVEKVYDQARKNFVITNQYKRILNQISTYQVVEPVKYFCMDTPQNIVKKNLLSKIKNRLLLYSSKIPHVQKINDLGLKLNDLNFRLDSLTDKINSLKILQERKTIAKNEDI